MSGLYEARFASTNHPELDAETTLLEDRPLTLDEIVAACRKYKVLARVIEDGRLIGDFVPS